MEIAKNAKTTEQPSQSYDKLYMENTLLRIAGALFSHDAKRASTRTQDIELNKGIKEKNIVIRPDARLGQPGQLSHKIFVALIKKHSDCGRPVQKEISFTRREIGRLIGRKDWGGRDSEQLARALHEIHYAFVKTYFKESDGRYIEHSFNIFPEIWIERREFASDPIEARTVMLANPIVASLQDEHFVCLNHSLMQGLGTIGQALYMRLFFHFANLYEGANSQRLVFQKRYDDICTEWLGGLTILGHKSKIVREQLGQHLDQLVATGFLASYLIDSAKSKGSVGFTITFRPGQLFYDDYDRFYRRRQQAPVGQEFRPGQREIAEPVKLVALFAEKRTGVPAPSIATAYTKDVQTAKQLLAALAFGEMPAFIDFALAEARKTNFDVQTIGGIRQYLPGYLAARQRRAVAMAQAADQKAKEQEQSAYTSYRRAAATDIFMNLPESERHAIEAQARAHASTFGGSLRQTMFEFAKLRFTIERYGDRLQALDDWKATRTAR
jgi:hypothetical protein